MYRTIKSTEKPTTSSGYLIDYVYTNLISLPVKYYISDNCWCVYIGQSDTCENGSQVNSQEQARDLQGLWNNSSRYVLIFVLVTIHLFTVILFYTTV